MPGSAPTKPWLMKSPAPQLALMASSQPNRPARMKKVAGTTITPMSTWNRSVMVVAHRPETKVNTMMTAKIIAVMARRFQPVKAAMLSTLDTTLLAIMPHMPITEVMATTERVCPS